MPTINHFRDRDVVENNYLAVLGAAGATQLTVNQTRVVVDMTTSAQSIYLPPVAKAKGGFYTIEAPLGSTNSCTIACSSAQDDARGWRNIVLDAVDDYVVLYSDGERWIIVAGAAIGMPYASVDQGTDVDGAITVSPAMIFGGLIDGDPGGNVLWTMCTGTVLCAAVPGYTIGDTWRVLCHNGGSGAVGETITITADTGCTLKGIAAQAVMTENTNEIMELIIRITGTNTYDCYMIGPL